MNRQLHALERLVGGRRAARQQRPGPRHVVVVAGGKGGVGMSTVAALLAYDAARTRRVLLVDADPGFGALHLLFHAQAFAGSGVLRTPGVSVSDVLIPISERLDLIPAGLAGVNPLAGSGSDFADGEDDAADGATGPAPVGAAEWRLLLRRVAGQYAAYDLVIVDAGCRLDGVLAALEAGAGRMLAVAESGRIAAAATFALIKAALAAYPRLPVDVVINRAEDREAVAVHEILQIAVDRFLGARVALAGAVPADASLAAAIAAGTSIQAVPEDASAVAAVRDLRSRLAAELEAPAVLSLVREV